MAPAPSHPAVRLLWTITLSAIFLAMLVWAWRQPFAISVRTAWEMSRMPPASILPVPVRGVRANDIADTFGAPRGRDRQHAGVDIFATRGTAVVSSTRGVVVAIRDGGLGGRQVWIHGPGGERYYYAHLDDWTPGLARGDVVEAGTPLGTVGTTGNARGTPPHLHFGIYGGQGANDPLPRLRAGARTGNAAR